MSRRRLFSWCRPDTIRSTGVRCPTCHEEILRGLRWNQDGGHSGSVWLSCECHTSHASYSLSGGYSFDGDAEYRNAWRDTAYWLLFHVKFKAEVAA